MYLVEEHEFQACFLLSWGAWFAGWSKEACAAVWRNPRPASGLDLSKLETLAASKRSSGYGQEHVTPVLTLGWESFLPLVVIDAESPSCARQLRSSSATAHHGILPLRSPSHTHRPIPRAPSSRWSLPAPGSLGLPRTARTYTRTRLWAKRLLLASAFLGVGYAFDKQVWASGVARSLRTFGTGLLVALDYKLNFRAEPLLPSLSGSADDGPPPPVEDVHRRNAERLSRLLHANGGLYLKIGQAIAMQSALLPPEFQRMFARMFDDAPSVAWEEVEKVVREDFGGRSPEEVFGVSFSGEEGLGVMEREARASASVAQVHWARLPDGREVAVKIQKPDIAKQIGWDLWSFKVVAWVYTWWFELPLYSMVPFVTERLQLETDFINEAKNSETMRRLIQEEPSLRGRVYVPKVYEDLSSKRVMTTEWIEGVRLWDRDAITNPWYGGNGKGTPGVDGTPLTPAPDMAAVRAELRRNPDSNQLKPDRDGVWKGRRGTGGLGLSKHEVMSTIIDLFSAQIFKFGVVHCDPHPGNMFVRRLPNGRAEIVLIDHGLYVYMSETFRRQYGEFWRALMTFDNATIHRVCAEWGIGGADLFASATLMRPYEGGDGTYRRQLLLGEGTEHMTERERRVETQRRMKLAGVFVLSDVLFYFFRLRQLLGLGGGMEDEVEARMKKMAGEYGVELQHDVFQG
ncbi:ABC1 domain-containing protein [Magnaporthiopsis poae ATCC 64411]|uniref:ABC1 domain-containing protein n=1 Tax=Magnaporthiopsis poae (strain ATCC 64411 / 73-15) TaxID=644358 RepID=A0A0C4EDJ4_MAGP6|nr:ABC1 domain-containing protein [Magnaporthiopsis poae ATCC 64411]